MPRNPVFDNAKFLMIFCVVFGHLIEPFIYSREIIKVIWMFIYTFHMPIFVFLAGIFAKEQPSSSDRRKDLINLWIPLIVFTLLFEIYNYATTGQVSNYTKGVMPFWILWFLSSLIIWKVALPYFTNFKFPIALSIIISLGAGYFDSINYFLGISRTIYFFPFFLMGFYSKDLWSKFQSIGDKKYIVYILSLIGVLILVFYFKEQNHRWLWGSFSYKKLGESGLAPLLIRLFMYSLSMVCIISILGLIPSIKTTISQWGQNSLYVYLWHGFIVKLSITFGVIEMLSIERSLVIVTVMGTIALISTCILSTNAVKIITDKLLLAPATRLLFKSSK
ncbi:acyltransferase family protein [Vibrio sp. E150_018]